MSAARGRRRVRRALARGRLRLRRSSTSPTRTWSATPGVIPAAVKAIETVDECLGRVVEAVHAGGRRVHRHGRPRQRRPHARARRQPQHRPLAEPGAADRDRRGGGPCATAASWPTWLRRCSRCSGSGAAGGDDGHQPVADARIRFAGVRPADHRGPRRAARAGVLQPGSRRRAHARVRAAGVERDACAALHAAEVAALGYEMVLGNTFHLFIEPGQELRARDGRSARVHGLGRPIITDSGGFQVFSMGHGSVAEEIKRRRGATTLA